MGSANRKWPEYTAARPFSGKIRDVYGVKSREVRRSQWVGAIAFWLGGKARNQAVWALSVRNREKVSEQFRNTKTRTARKTTSIAVVPLPSNDWVGLPSVPRGFTRSPTLPCC